MELDRLLCEVVHGLTTADGDDPTVPVGVVRVRRHAAATAAVAAPLLVSTGPGGGARIVAGEERMAAVHALIAALVSGLRAVSVARVVVVNPRRRPLPPVLRSAPGVCEVRDGRGLLAEVGRDGGDAHLVVLDHPHDLGLAGRRLVHAAASGSGPRCLLVHHAADSPDVDLEHRRLRVPRTGVPHPDGGCELWPARGGWRWAAHPELRVELPTDVPESGRPRFRPGTAAAATDGAASTTGPGAVPARRDRLSAAHARRSPTAGSGMEAYEALLDLLAGVAREFDQAVAAARADERRALDQAAAVRRRTLVAIDAEERAIHLLLRRVGGARSPPARRPIGGHAARTVAPQEKAVDATDLRSLRAARAALARAVDSATGSRGR